MKILSDQCGDKVHIAIGSRTPVNINLPTLLAAGQAIEIPSANLRFSDREVEEAMGSVLDQGELEDIQSQLEGWPVAVQMTRLLGDRNTFASTASKDQKVLSQGHLADYLVTNVLESQSEELQEFLLETSILQSFNIELADSVRDHKNSQKLIHQLDSLQALVIPLDDDFMWFRYHHLFSECVSDFLKQEDPDRFIELHRRAAKWCSENRLIAEAVNYANAIKDYELSKQIINDNSRWMRLLCFGGAGYFNGLFANIPDEILANDPQILYSKVYTCALGGDFKNALRHHNAAEALIERDGITPELLVDRMGVGTGILRRVEFKMEREGGWLKERLEMIEKAKAEYPSIGKNLIVISSFINHALAIQSNIFGDFNIARDYMEVANAESKKGFNPVGEGYLNASFGITEFWCNDLEEACHRFQSTLENVDHLAGNYANINSIIGTLSKSVEYWQSDPAEKEAFNIEGELERLVGADGWYDVYAIGFDTIVHDALCSGEYEKAEELVGKLEQSTSRLAIERVTQLTEVLRLDLFVANNSLGLAESIYNKISEWLSIDTTEMNDHGWLHWVVSCYACARYLMAVGNYGKAYQFANAGIQVADTLDVVLMRVRGNVIKATILERTDKRDDALAALKSAIVDAARITAFKPFATDLSDGLLAEAVSSVMNGTELHGVKDFAARLAVTGAQKMFSSREEEVLQGIARGKSNKEIARELDLTDNTIKFHLRNIYRKLGVKKRVAAVEKARELGVLS
ncbi:MAG: LuxR C-terminal-related transcriptional regulator [Parasphingorhabdus sp.]